jgi:myo-inositol-1(or 4)-monophosphatase
LTSEILKLLPSVLQAGEEVKRIYNTDFTVQWKEKDDPLTQADLITNEIITNKIKELFPKDNILSEEEDYFNTNPNENLWILDPIDGTREFVQKRPQFAISLGFRKDNIIHSGIVYNPITGELFVGDRLKGYFSSKNPNSLVELKKNHFNQIENKKPKCFVSQSEYKNRLFIDEFWTDNFQINPMGSIAYKLGLLSNQEADLCISLRPKSDWDIAAGVALLNSRGGVVLDLQNLKPIPFDQPLEKKQGLIAGDKNLVDSILHIHSKKILSFYNNSIKNS